MVRKCEVNLATKQRFYLSPALTKYKSVADLDKHVWDSQVNGLYIYYIIILK